MTRIASFSIYACKECGQKHIKPEYGSISMYQPPDLFVEPSAIKICQRCRWAGKLSEFKYLGLRGKVNTRKPSQLEICIRTIMRKPYIEVDVRKLYPYLH